MSVTSHAAVRETRPLLMVTDESYRLNAAADVVEAEDAAETRV
jgi:hypothetical protein